MIPDSFFSVVLRLVLITAGTLVRVPPEFYQQLAALLEVPEIVLVFIAPLAGSFCTVMVEALPYLKGKMGAPKSVAYWPAKLLVGWICGLFLAGVLSVFAKGSVAFPAFLGGMVGYWFITDYLPDKLKKFKRDDLDKPE